MNANTHLYLYAKGWYKRENVIEDLKRIVAVRSGISNVSDNDVFSVLLPLVFEEILNCGNPEYKFIEFVSRIGSGMPIQVAKGCLSLLSIAPVEGRDIGKPDAEVLPLAEEMK